jgi:hypothetical protein
MDTNAAATASRAAAVNRTRFRIDTIIFLEGLGGGDQKIVVVNSSGPLILFVLFLLWRRKKLLFLRGLDVTLTMTWH